MRRFRIFLVVFFFSSLGWAQSRVDCNTLQSTILRQLVHYCAMVPPGYDDVKHASERYPVLYYLHGLGDNEQGLFKSGGWNLIEDLREQKKIGDLLLVAPEGKGSFYVNSADGRVRYSDFFLREFMPNIEGKYRIRRERSARAIGGISMGGYGALRFAFAHPELFASVTAQSAALITEAPKELDAAIRAGMPLGEVLGAVFGHPINPVHWNQNYPLVLARKNGEKVKRLAIYFNCGRDDQYGFEKGAAALDRQLTQARVEHEFHLYPGDHSPVYFLAHLGETVEFSWHALGVAEQRSPGAIHQPAKPSVENAPFASGKVPK